MKKIPVWLARFVLVLVVIPIALGVYVWFQNRSDAPSVQDAPWAVQTYLYANNISTPSHVFYGKAFSSINGEPALQGYWEWNGRGYNYIEGVKVFKKKDWGAVSIVRRQG